MSTLKIGDKTVKTITIESKDVKSISIDGITVWEKESPVTLDYFYIENCDSVAGTITFENMSGKNIEYSNDAANWTTLDLSTGTNTISNVAAGDKIYLRGDNTALGSSTYGKHISADFNHNLGGNICSLLDKTNFSIMTSISGSAAFGYLFHQDTKLISAGFNIGNVTTLSGACYYYTFDSCVSLTIAPDLSNVTSIGNYGLQYAFYNCSSLTVAPDLSNVTSLGYGALIDAVAYCHKLQTIYVPNVDTWDTSKFTNWITFAGDQTTTSKQMIFQTQELLDACPSGTSGYGNYTKVLAQ